jgi:hypothetical protein
MNKRGQFYLVAVIVILAIIASIATVYNTAITKKSDTTIYDLSKEIEYESSKVLDRGVFFAENEVQIKSEIRNITDYYARSTLGQDLIVVYGNGQNLHLLYYNNTESGTVGFFIGGSQIVLPQTELKLYENVTERKGDTITINIAEGVDYTFELRKGQFLFVVLKKEKDGERYISAS